MSKITSPIRVVIAEDSRAMTDLLACTLRAAGDIHVVGITANGAEGVRLMQRLHPDLVTMDIYITKNEWAEAVRGDHAHLPGGASSIILTSMEDYGGEMAQKKYKTGRVTVAQEKERWSVYGMPRQAVARGAVDSPLTPEQIRFTLGQVTHSLPKGEGGPDG